MTPSGYAPTFRGLDQNRLGMRMAHVHDAFHPRLRDIVLSAF